MSSYPEKCPAGNQAMKVFLRTGVEAVRDMENQGRPIY